MCVSCMYVGVVSIICIVCGSGVIDDRVRDGNIIDVGVLGGVSGGISAGSAH